MLDRKFVYPQYRPEKSRRDRWIFNRLNYDGINDVTYLEPYQVKPKKLSRNKSSSSFLQSWSPCTTWNNRLKFFVILFCSIGCFYSLFILSESYFSYEHNTNIIIRVTPNIKMTALSVCLYYPTLLMQSHPKYSELTKTDDSLDIKDTEKKLTMEDIFDMTPSPDQVLYKCSYRLPNEFDLFKGNKTICNEFFAVSKYYTVQYICYRFTPKMTADKDYSFLAVRYSLIAPGMFYQVSMRRRLFENATSLQPSTYNWDGYPKSRFSTVIKNSPPSSKNKLNQTLSQFYLSNYKVQNDLLPAPYETNCIKYSEETPYAEQSDCFDNCMRNLTIITLNKLPFATVTKDSLPLKLVTSSDFENSTFESLYRSFETRCAKKVCFKNNCRQYMFVTTFIRREWTSSGLVFRVDTPNSPDFVTIFEPKSQLFDFLIDVFNCFSNWFGFSFMDFTKLSAILEKLAY